MNTKSLYQNRKEFYTDPVSGRFNKIRLSTMFFVVFCFFLFPWLDWNGHQAFLFDVSFNRFYFFNSVFWPQDFVLISLFFIFFVIALFAVTLYAGRVWCGFFCPQSIWIKMAVFFSRLFEGKRNSRVKFKNGAFSINKFLILFLKHFFWIFLSLSTSFTFIAYFIPVKWMFFSLISFDIFYNTFFWVLFFGILTYFNIGWFKEQLCFLLCPYSRLQSVMFDESTLIVSYDKERGEKRGARSKNMGYASNELGDCVDCKKCVTCCPTGIDIRDGLQMECISCGACIDACNDVMLKLGYKPNLISFRRENQNFSNKSSSKIKFTLYAFVLFILIFLLCYFYIKRPLVHFSVSRSQYQLFNVTNDNFIENFFFVKIMNKSDSNSKYLISVKPDIFTIVGNVNLDLKPGEMNVLNVTLKIKNVNSVSNFMDIYFYILDVKENRWIQKKSRFVLSGSF